MAPETQRPVERVAPFPTAQGMKQNEHRDQHRGVRVALIVLSAFMALTAVQGAIFVVPALPLAWLHQGLVAPFSDYIIPALALGILCGGSALAAVGALLVQMQLGALAALAAGSVMIGFELVEIMVVGFTAATMPTQPAAWLQVFYLVLGTTIVVLSLRLWKAETGSHLLPWAR